MSHVITKRIFEVAVTDAPVFERNGRNWVLTGLEIHYVGGNSWWRGTLTLVKKDGTRGEVTQSLFRYELSHTETFILIDRITAELHPGEV